MSYIPPHKHGQAKPTGPIMRAVMLDVALCLLGVALYLQTKLIVLPMGCALIGSVIVISAVLQKRKANASAPVRKQAQRPAAPRAPRAPASTNDSNVIEFKRKTGRKSGRSGDDNQKSNWPSA